MRDNATAIVKLLLDPSALAKNAAQLIGKQEQEILGLRSQVDRQAITISALEEENRKLRKDIEWLR